MSARERFERTRKAVIRLHDVQLAIMYDCEDWKPPAVKAHNEQADPTASRAIYRVDELADKLEALRKEEAELQSLIGESLVIIAAVRDGFGEIYATLLEHRYIDVWTWGQIYDEYEIQKSTGHYLLGIAFDWIDSVGVSRLLRGEVDV